MNAHDNQKSLIYSVYILCSLKINHFLNSALFNLSIIDWFLYLKLASEINNYRRFNTSIPHHSALLLGYHYLKDKKVSDDSGLSGHHGRLGLSGAGRGHGARHVIVDGEERQPVVRRDPCGDQQPDASVKSTLECYSFPFYPLRKPIL